MTSILQSIPPSPAFARVGELIEELHEALTAETGSRTATAVLVDLTGLFSCEVEEVRYEILTELIELEYVGSRALLLGALQSDKSALVRHEAAFGLGIVGTQTHVGPLCHAMLNDASAMVRHEAAVALANIGGDAALEALARATLDSDPEVAASARYGIQTLYRSSAEAG